MRPSLLLLATAALCLGPILRLAAAYAPVSVFVPDSDIGMASEYSGIFPKWGDNNTVLRVPASTTNETNLVWTFWDHTRFDPAEWPHGPAARVSITVIAESSLDVRVSSFVRAGNWSAPSPKTVVALPAGKPVTISIPLSAIPSEPVEILRVLVEANEQMPPFTITAWSVGQDSAAIASSAP